MAWGPDPAHLGQLSGLQATGENGRRQEAAGAGSRGVGENGEVHVVEIDKK